VNEFEDRLRQLKLRPPSEELDRRVQAQKPADRGIEARVPAGRGVEAEVPAYRRKRVPWWWRPLSVPWPLAVLVALLVAAALVLKGTASRSAPAALTTSSSHLETTLYVPGKGVVFRRIDF
jgi:hypothetical protein